jgi:deoxyribodipyrimidine photo-lyase
LICPLSCSPAAHKLKKYADQRNDPNQDVASNLSPYLHFGQISAQAAVLRVKASK